LAKHDERNVHVIVIAMADRHQVDIVVVSPIVNIAEIREPFQNLQIACKMTMIDHCAPDFDSQLMQTTSVNNLS
jgi:hypothetical protein